MTDLAPPTIPVCRFSYGQWRENLARRKTQDPSGLPIRKQDIKRVIGPVELTLPYVFGAEHYAADLVVCGELPRFLGYGEQPGWAIWLFSEGSLIVHNSLNRRLRGRIEVILVEGQLQPLLSRLVRLSREEQLGRASDIASEGRGPHDAA